MNKLTKISKLYLYFYLKKYGNWKFLYWTVRLTNSENIVNLRGLYFRVKMRYNWDMKIQSSITISAVKIWIIV